MRKKIKGPACEPNSLVTECLEIVMARRNLPGSLIANVDSVSHPVSRE